MFQVGDAVRWTSQSSGYTKEKVGRVIAIVPCDGDPRKYCPSGTRLRDPGRGRPHTSYLVQVGQRTNLHWPLVNKLSLVAPTTQESEVERLNWNLAGCLTIAESGKPMEYSHEMATPALDAVNKLAKKNEQLTRELAAAHWCLAHVGADACEGCPAAHDDALCQTVPATGSEVHDAEAHG